MSRREPWYQRHGVAIYVGWWCALLAGSIGLSWRMWGKSKSCEAIGGVPVITVGWHVLCAEPKR